MRKSFPGAWFFRLCGEEVSDEAAGGGDREWGGEFVG